MVSPNSLEHAIIAALLPVMKPLGVKVELVPDRPESYNFTANAALLVFYESSNDGPHETESPVSFNRVMSFELNVLSRDLRTASGVHTVVEALRSVLDSWTPEGAESARVVCDGFKSREEGVWQHTLTLSVTCRVIRPITSW